MTVPKGSLLTYWDSPALCKRCILCNIILANNKNPCLAWLVLSWGKREMSPGKAGNEIKLDHPVLFPQITFQPSICNQSNDVANNIHCKNGGDMKAEDT